MNSCFKFKFIFRFYRALRLLSEVISVLFLCLGNPEVYEELHALKEALSHDFWHLF